MLLLFEAQGKAATPDLSQTAAPRWQVLAGGVTAVSSVFVWLLLTHNKFFTIHEGWFSYYALLMKNGQVPYKDFYFFTQPVSLLISRCIAVFGDKLIYFRYYGLAERVVLTAAWYYLLSREFSVAAAVCGTVASSFFFYAYPTDALFSYLYTCLLFFVLALVCFQQALRSTKWRSGWLSLAGLAASLSFFTKQSSGLLAVAAIIFAVLVISETIRDSVRDLASFAAGLLAGAVPFIVWLVWNGAWQPYVQQVFLGAASSKGGLRAVLTGFLVRQTQPVPLTIFILLGTCLWMLARRRLFLFTAPPARPMQPPTTVAMMVTAGAVILAVLSVRRVGEFPLAVMIYSSRVIVEVILYLLLVAFAFVVSRRYLGSGRKFTRGSEMTVALLIASVFWTFGCGMSWSVGEQCAIPTLGLLIAFVYDRTQLGRGRAMRILALTWTVLFVFLGVWHKWSDAFDWEGWRAPMAVDGYHSRWEPISDYELDRGEALMYDTIFDDIAKYTRQGDAVVTFPTIPLFNFVNRRFQPTFAPVGYWDVCPDDVARRDAESVRNSRPEMIVNLQLADYVWKEHDLGWRGGRRSGQRDIQDAIDNLTSSGNYRLLHTYLTPFYKMNLNVWVRKQ